MKDTFFLCIYVRGGGGEATWPHEKEEHKEEEEEGEEGAAAAHSVHSSGHARLFLCVFCVCI